MAQASYIAKPGRRLWAGAFDGLTVLVLFLVAGVVGEQLGVNLTSWAVLGFLYFGYQLGCLLGRDGRTLGKTAVDICIVSVDGTAIGTARAVLRAGFRSWPFLFFDTHLFEYSTGVLRSDALPASLILLAMVVVEITLLERSPTGQTVADRIARSLVVNLPPLQPHRAPAVPMYSAHDAEFGSPKAPPKGRNWTKRSNSASLADAFSSLRCACGAAKRER
jgi:uncharacterized RDD family membrane protein YckC